MTKKQQKALMEDRINKLTGRGKANGAIIQKLKRKIQKM